MLLLLLLLLRLLGGLLLTCFDVSLVLCRVFLLLLVTPGLLRPLLRLLLALQAGLVQLLLEIRLFLVVGGLVRRVLRLRLFPGALRFIELLHDLPALTARDANSDALLDMFDFSCEALKTPPEAPEAGTATCDL